MSQLLAPERTLVDQIPLGRRLREIMKEKGSFYSISAMAARLGVSRETLRMMLNGEREIYSFELERIAKDLKVSTERIVQSDVWTKHQEIDELRKSRQDIERMEQLIDECTAVACGMTEKANCRRKKAFIYFWRAEYHKALQIMVEIRPVAEQISKQYGSHELLNIVIQNMTNHYVIDKEYEQAAELIAANRHVFERSALGRNVMYHALSRIKLHENDWKTAKAYEYQSLKEAKQHGSADMIGRICFFISELEYMECNYGKASEQIEVALQSLQSEQIRIEAEIMKGKVLIKLRYKKAAIEHIQQLLRSNRVPLQSDLEGRLYVMLAQATGKVRYAQRAAGNPVYSKSVRVLAYRYLLLYYKRRANRDRNGVRMFHSVNKRRFPLDGTL